VWVPLEKEVVFHVKVTLPDPATAIPFPSTHSLDHHAEVICAVTFMVPFTVAPLEGELSVTIARAAPDMESTTTPAINTITLPNLINRSYFF
jgi:hypothetical protein